ncbi:dihydrodipicolinate synthase [Ochromonadaceae sp. CCMP2298]|nr:dihydrodipicolinate synthase [Ochromonadaceae sp. CCMP2298]
MALKPVVGGSVVALVTPMTAENKIDFPMFVDLLKWHIAEGTDGAVILGTTGEASTISLEERTEIIKIAVQTVNKAFPVIVGAGTIDPIKTRELCQHALDCGADASLVITPYYVKPPQRALVRHFLDLADSVALPMLLYNCPGRTGVDMKPETIAQISSHKNIVGVKDATGDLDRVKTLRDLCGKDFLIFSGEDDVGCQFMKLGGDGVISVTANVAPKKMHLMLTGAKKGDPEADKINDTLMPLHKSLFLESNPIPTKKALEIMGKIGSGIRPPLCSLDETHHATITAALKAGNAL